MLIRALRPSDWPAVARIYGEGIALHERVGFRRLGVQERVGRDPAGRWRDVVLLERRSPRVGV